MVSLQQSKPPQSLLKSFFEQLQNAKAVTTLWCWSQKERGVIQRKTLKADRIPASVVCRAVIEEDRMGWSKCGPSFSKEPLSSHIGREGHLLQPSDWKSGRTPAWTGQSDSWGIGQSQRTFTEGHWEPKSYKLDCCAKATFGLMPSKADWLHIKQRPEREDRVGQRPAQLLHEV